MRRAILLLLLVGLFLAGCAAPTPTPLPGEPSTMQITSPAFAYGGEIPVVYSCQGDNLSPPLLWRNMPQGTRHLALILEDPDALLGTFVHWVIYNIPATATGLAEEVPATPTLDDGSLQGINDFSVIGYAGPCPPQGPAHRYFFRLFALDTVLDLPPGATKPQLESAMEGHTLAQVELVGLYARQ